MPKLKNFLLTPLYLRRNLSESGFLPSGTSSTTNRTPSNHSEKTLVWNLRKKNEKQDIQMKSDLGQIYSRRPLTYYSPVTWPWQPYEIIKTKRTDMKPCLQCSGYRPCYFWTKPSWFGAFLKLFSHFYNKCFWNKWIAYFYRKWDCYFAIWWQYSRLVSE